MMRTAVGPERFETVVVGGGQAGLTVGYHLAKRNRPLVILDANERIGDAWRQRWNSLRLFTPARYNGLPGWRFPAPGWSFPSKDEMAEYLEAYATRFDLPTRTCVRVDLLSRNGDHYVVSAGDRRFEADNVVLALGTHQSPTVPAFAAELDAGILQLHSSEYRGPFQFQDGAVLVVGAGNSGAEIALEAVPEHPTSMSGRHPGHIPFDTQGLAARVLLVPLVLRVVFHRLLTTNTPMGRKARPKVVSRGGPLIRLKPRTIDAAGIERLPRVVGVDGGLPLLADGRVLEVANVVWCTGFHPDYSWIDLPGFSNGEPVHSRGVVAGEPGVYLVGREFLYSLSSGMVHGAVRDADHVAKHIATRRQAGRTAPRVAGVQPAVAEVERFPSTG